MQCSAGVDWLCTRVRSVFLITLSACALELCANIYCLQWHFCNTVFSSRPAELCADVYRRQSAENQSMADEMISLTIGGVGCAVAVRSHTMEVTATLAGVTLKVRPPVEWRGRWNEGERRGILLRAPRDALSGVLGVTTCLTRNYAASA